MEDLLGAKVRDRAPRGSVPRWAERYGYSERAVKKFLVRGRAVGEMPPFDYPEKMEDWGQKYLPQITKRFRAGVEMAMGNPSSAVDLGKPATEDEKIELPEVHDSELGVEWQLAQYQREFAMLGKLRKEALEKSEFSRASNYFDQQQKVSAEIRQLERLLPTVLEQRGDYQRTAAVRDATIEFLKVLKRGLLGRAEKVSARLRETSTDAAMREVWKTEIHAVFRECCEAGFAETLILE